MIYDKYRGKNTGPQCVKNHSQFQSILRKRLVQTSICLMESRKEVKKKINVFEAMHYIMDAWEQITQQTIQNCFCKAGYKYQSNVNEMANDDDDDNDFGQDWEELCRA
jgi:hypothetical protein